jgi:2-C-methyl-D-erythritol 4-phosphate cytidylyltransferase
MADKYSAIIPAGGASTRFGSPDKLKEKVGGKSVISHSMDLFDADPDCEVMLIAASQYVREWISGDPLTFASPKMKLVEAGPSRAESVRNAALAAATPVLVIQDASRPNSGEELLGRVLATVQPKLGAAAARRVYDAVAGGAAKEQAGGKSSTVDSFLGPKADYRMAALGEHIASGALYELQTPQAYYRESYLAAVEHAGAKLASFEDDSALYRSAGFDVALVAGRLGNLRVVTADDLHLLYKLMGSPTKKKDKYGGLGW